MAFNLLSTVLPAYLSSGAWRLSSLSRYLASCGGLADVSKEHSVWHCLVQPQKQCPRVYCGQRQHHNHRCCWKPAQPAKVIVSLLAAHLFGTQDEC